MARVNLATAQDIADLSGTYEAASVDPQLADYTGRYTVPGTGTDARAAIQAALNAASSIAAGGYYAHLTRRTKTVKLPAGHYYISAVEGAASLTIPAGVTFDTSDASLYFDYPTSATSMWCGIQITQYGQLRVGKLFPSGNNSAPDTAHIYDAVRMTLTDNKSRVIGGKDSEINGFRGAGVRGVGAWQGQIRDVRITGNSYGVVWGHMGTAFTYTHSSTSGEPLAASSRTATDLWLDGVSMVNCGRGGLVGGASGDVADPNAVGFKTFGGVVSVDRCVMENIGTYAINVTNASAFSMRDCHVEEAGAFDGVINLDTVRVATIENLQYNLAGRSVPKPDGSTGNVTSVNFFKIASVQTFTLDGFYLHNTLSPALTFANSAATLGFRVGGVFCDSSVPAAGAMWQGNGYTHFSGAYNDGHPVVGTTHLWVDGSNALRRKVGAPTSASDGVRVDALTGVKTVISTPPTIGAGSTTTLSFNGSNVFDTDGFHSTTVTPSRITIPAGLAGTYLLSVSIPFSTNATGTLRRVRIIKNAAAAIEREDKQPATGVQTKVVLDVLDQAVAGDYYEVSVFHDATASLTVDNSVSPVTFSAVRVG